MTQVLEAVTKLLAVERAEWPAEGVVARCAVIQLEEVCQELPCWGLPRVRRVEPAGGEVLLRMRGQPERRPAGAIIVGGSGLIG